MNQYLTTSINYYLSKLLRNNLEHLKSVVTPGAAIQANSFNNLNTVIESLYIEPDDIQGVASELEKLTLVHQRLNSQGDVFRQECQKNEEKIFWLLGLKAIPKGQKPKILLIDDDITMLKLLSHLLKKEGYDVYSVAEQDRILSTVHALMPDLILMDVHLSEISGFEVCSQLKAEKDCQNIPIVFLSADDNAFRVQEALDAGGIAYITKPFHMSNFLSGMKQLIGQRN